MTRSRVQPPETRDFAASAQERAVGEARAAMQEVMLRHDDRQGPDVRLELEHLSRNLALDAIQTRRIRAVLLGNQDLFRRHAALRAAHRRRMMALRRRMERLNRQLARALERMAAKEGAWRERIRAELRPDQQARYDVMMRERDRLEREWRRRIEERVRGEEHRPRPTPGHEPAAGHRPPPV